MFETTALLLSSVLQVDYAGYKVLLAERKMGLTLYLNWTPHCQLHLVSTARTLIWATEMCIRDGC